MDNTRSKAILPTLLLTLAMAGCSTGSATPVMPGAPSALQTAAMRPPMTPTIDLHGAGNFAILAGTTVTNTGATTVGGSIGIFPGTAITGFPPGKITLGTLEAGTPTAQLAEMALTKAYNTAKGAVHNPILVSGNLGGRTLKPGLYRSSSGLAVSSGDLTLDGGGKRDAVFLFQMASTFNMTTGRKIILANGAEPRNIYWAVGSSATLGTGCTFYGNLLVYKSISMATGTVMTGRALARLGAVTMQGNTIVKAR